MSSEPCDCRETLEARLTERFQETSPTASNHKVTLQGYAYMLGSAPSRRPFMEYETFAHVPLKAGGHKPKKTRGNMLFNFCPFCGVKILGEEV